MRVERSENTWVVGACSRGYHFLSAGFRERAFEAVKLLVFSRARNRGLLGDRSEVFDPVAAILFGGIQAGVSLIQ